MDFESFVNRFISCFINNDKKCLTLLERNKKIVENELSKDGNEKSVNKFVTEINNAILFNMKKFKFCDEILKHDSLKHVYNVFRKSDILIQACKYENIKVAEWLRFMDIDPCIQDEEGMTALMYAVNNSKLGFVIEGYKTNYKGLNMEDKNGNNVLFYSIGKPEKLISLLKNADINHINHDGETILHYCCRNELFFEIGIYFDIFENIDLNIPDKDGKTTVMNLIEKQKTNLFDHLNSIQRKFAFNYINEQGESFLCYLIKKMYLSNDHPKFNKNYVDIIINLVKADVDFNVVVDEDGNTALMALLIAGDYETFYFITKYVRNLDYAKKNKFGESVTSLFFKLGVPSYYKEDKNKEFLFFLQQRICNPCTNFGF